MHLEKNALREGFETLATFPQMPVAELAVELAGGCGTRQYPLVLGIQLVKA